VARNYNYRNLIVWQRAQELALAIIELVQRLPQSWANAVLVRQMVSAATSIGANIAEGHGRYTPRAHRNHLSIAKGSAAETDSWLDLLRRAGWITAEEEAPLHAECMEIMAILTSKIQDLDRLEGVSVPRLQEEPGVYTLSDTAQPLPPFTLEDYYDDRVLSS
jgi:four helix bundle protein